MIINISEQLEGFDRYNGGWIKTIEGLDKDYKNGYSLVGDFLPVSSGNIDLEENILYLDCSIGGSRKNQERNYHLFKVIEGNIFTIQSIECGGSDWAMSLWDSIERELDLKENNVDLALKAIDKLSDSEFFDLMKELGDNSRRYQKLIELYIALFIKEGKGHINEIVKEVENMEEEGLI